MRMQTHTYTCKYMQILANLQGCQAKAALSPGKEQDYPSEWMDKCTDDKAWTMADIADRASVTEYPI